MKPDRSSRICPVVCLGWLVGLPLTAAAIEVVLQRVDGVPEQRNASEAASAMTAPVAVGGGLAYGKRDHTAGEAPFGIFQDGAVVRLIGDSISGNEISTVGVEHSDGMRALVGAFSNFAAPTPTTSYRTLNLLEGGGVTRILSRGTAFPGYPDPPHPANPVGLGTISGNRVAFMIREALGSPRLPTAIATATATGADVQIIAKEGDPAPGGGNFGIFPQSTLPYVHGNTIVFPANFSGGSGIFRWKPEEGLSRLVASGTPRPEGGNFGALSDFRVVHDSESVVFYSSSNPNALYRLRGGTIGLLASGQQSIPGGLGNFMRTSQPSLRGGRVVFQGSRAASGEVPAQSGIYLEAEGVRHRVVDLTTDFGAGLIPVEFRLHAGSAWIDDSTIGFAVAFANFSAGVYRASMDEPVRRLDAEVVHTAVRAGHFVVASKAGFRYELLRSASLRPQDGVVVLTVDGTGAAVQLAFDDSASSDLEAYFRVRERPVVAP